MTVGRRGEIPVSSHTFGSPVGMLRISATDVGICGLSFELGAEKKTLSFSRTSDHDDGRRLAHLDEATRQLDEYFTGARTAFDLVLDILIGTPFQRRVWETLLAIPYGETATYGEVATAIGMPTSARAVGGANNRNPIALIIPCHRVIGADGSLVGFGGGLATKRALLALERGRRDDLERDR